MKFYVKYDFHKVRELIEYCEMTNTDVKITIGISEKFGNYVVIDKYYASLEFARVISDLGFEEAKNDKKGDKK